MGRYEIEKGEVEDHWLSFKTDRKEKVRRKGLYRCTIKSINAKVTTRIKIQTLSDKKFFKKKKKNIE